MEDLQKCCGGKKHCIVGVAVVLVLLALTAWLGLKARNEAKQYRYIGRPVERDLITVQGEGRVTTLPDIARIEIGTVIERKSVAEAQKENTRIMNGLNAKLLEFGVAKADMQTSSYNISPQYDWNEGKQTLRGYQVSQNLRVKVRDLDKVSDILGAAGELGVNQVGGIEFTLDEPEVVKQAARIKALENAKSKAEALAQVAGVKLVRVVSFNENSYEPYYNAPYAMDKAMGLGGGAAPAPAIEPGSAEFVLNVNVTYEIE